jgi:hypothetical protein
MPGKGVHHTAKPGKAMFMIHASVYTSYVNCSLTVVRMLGVYTQQVHDERYQAFVMHPLAFPSLAKEAAHLEPVPWTPRH